MSTCSSLLCFSFGSTGLWLESALQLQKRKDVTALHRLTLSEERRATVISLHSEEHQFAKKKRKMKNLGANFSLPLYSKVKKKRNQLLLLCLMLEKSQRTKIFHFNCYSKINCDLFFQIGSELQISIRIKMVTKWMRGKLKNGKVFTLELPNS